jgi:hypothetical protein
MPATRITIRVILIARFPKGTPLQTFSNLTFINAVITHIIRQNGKVKEKLLELSV